MCAKLSFDATKVAPQQPLEAIPREQCGWMPAIIIESEVAATKTNKDGTRLALTAEIIDGDCKGRRVFDGFNLKNSNKVAEEIGMAQLSALCHATGVMKVSDSKELHSKPFLLKVGYEDGRTVGDKSYEPRNFMAGFKPLEGAAAATPAAGTGGAAPAWAGKKDTTPPATPAKPTPGGKKPTPAAAPKERQPDTRVFFVVAGDDSNELTGDDILQALKDGMPLDNPVLLKDEFDADNAAPWKTAADYGIAVEEAAAEPAKPATPAKPTPKTPAAPASNTPPWKKK